ncbi:MAG: hypothetical protein HC915_13070, partial [Anaerolineae bacterium]|nr:hypothetical protein [Anaerolineae bacterium]
AVLLEWDHQLAVIEAQHVRQIVATVLNTDLAFVDQKILIGARHPGLGWPEHHPGMLHAH